MVEICFKYGENGEKMTYFETPNSTLEEVRCIAKYMTKCRAPYCGIFWVYDGVFHEIVDESLWEQVWGICYGRIELIVRPNWYGLKLDDDDDYEEGVVECADKEMSELMLSRQMRGLGLRGGNPEGESSNANANEGDEASVVERDEVYSSDSGVEPFEELMNREKRVGGYEFPEEWISGEWQLGFENDLEIHAASWSSTSEYFKKNKYFPTKSDVQRYVKKWHIENSRQCGSPRSCQSEILFKCTNARCSWDLRAKALPGGGWEIARVGVPHTCVNVDPIKHHKNLDAKMIYHEIYRLVKDNRSVKIKFLQDHIKALAPYHEYPTYRKMWYVKCNVLENLYGTHESAFGKLPQQLLAIQHFNRGSVFDFHYKDVYGDTAVFCKCFWSYAPSIHAFQHCLPLISIDGTHLYRKYTGKLLIAVAYDANNQVVPLAFCLCDRESIETWTWFLSHLQEHVTKDRAVTIISDRHAGIIRALESVYPEPINCHRYCARHLASNFNHHYKNKRMKERFSSMIYEQNKTAFLEKLDDLKAMDGGKYARFIERCGEFDRWSLAFDGGMRWGVMTTNYSECFNKVLKDACMLPVSASVDETFIKCVTYWVDRKKNAEDAKHRFAPKIAMLLKQSRDDAKLCKALTYQQGVVFYVSAVGERQDYTVNLEEWDCDCGRWRLFGVPCCHVVAAISHANRRLKHFVSPFLTNKKCIECYGMYFETLRQMEDWPPWEGSHVVCDPNMLIVVRGRKKKKRIPNEMDTSKQPKRGSCSRCGQPGHNKRSCKTQAQEE